jgi:hypothetical protein
MALFYIELYRTCDNLWNKRMPWQKKFWINPRFSGHIPAVFFGHTCGIFQIHGIPEVWFYTRRKARVWVY